MTAVAVIGAGWFAAPHGPDEGRPSACDPGTFREAEVDLRVQVAVAGLDYPRITSDVRITVPRAVPGVENLLAGTESESGRTAFACLLGPDRSPSEVRNSPPAVVIGEGVVVITHRSTTDVVHQSTAWADFTSVQVDTTGRPWRLAVDSPIGLRFAAWEVTLIAPDRWLSAPRPWRSAESDGTQLQWPRSVPTASRDGALTTSLEYRVVSAELRPDARSTTTARATDRMHKPFTWGVYWLSALIFCLVVRWHVRAPRGPAASFESVSARRARRAVRPLPYLVVIAGTQAVIDAVLPTNAPAWPVIAWIADAILLVLLASTALLWWLPRTAVAALAVTGAAALALTVPDQSNGRTWLTDAAAATAAFTISLLLVVGVGKALFVLLRSRTDTPRWLWWVGATAATVLILEELLLTLCNQERRQWLDYPPLFRDTSQIYRYYPLDLLDEAAWPALLITCAAVWRYWAEHWFEHGHRSPLRAAIVLFAIGPIWWDVQLWGIWWWAWLLGFAAIAVFWLLWPKLWPPVLAHPAVDTDDLRPEHLRHQARQWYADRPPRGPAPSAVHVLIAAGPGGTPTSTARTAIRLVALPAFIAGTGLTITKWITYPLVPVGRQHSVILSLVDTIAWEAAKWLLAAAALGMAWRHLPGRRGPTKALPLILAYTAAPVTLFLLTRAYGGVPDWIPLADVGLFVLVMVFVALRVDLTALDGTHEAAHRSGRLHRILTALGLDALPRWFIEAVTLVATLLAIWTALTGGDASFPTAPADTVGPPIANPAHAPHR
ncbi:DUF6185 family protein [Saccharothrix sp. NRRL B-16314]|uniref:DUF6185 family protein n=1 Tax=Saccharothrix sp. NRRL B-16314 TaxID=1463825 RepID=UPI0005276362|nr:DUF6185 family protein [Saccharothrix sp. NRRL B-16314]